VLQFGPTGDQLLFSNAPCVDAYGPRPIATVDQDQDRRSLRFDLIRPLPANLTPVLPRS